MPTPSAIRVNMFRFQVRIESQARTKNGQPAHHTTGVLSSSWIHWDARGLRTPDRAISPIERTNTGSASASPTQNRRVMSASS